MRKSFIAEELIVDWEEGGVVVGIDTRGRIRKRDWKVDRGGDVHTADVPVPLIECVGSNNGRRGAGVCVNGFVIGTKGIGHDPGRDPCRGRCCESHGWLP